MYNCKMKKGFPIALILAMTVSTIMAIPARRTPITVTQSDGTTLTLQLNGDEFFHYYTNDKGVPVRLSDNGMYVPYTIWQMQAATGHRSETTGRHGAESPGTSSMPKGESNVLVLLVQFKDLKFSIDAPNEAWKKQLNAVNYSEGKGYGSARDYFIAQSNGQFTPNFDVYGPYTVSQNLSYYGASDDHSNDCNPGEMVSEALSLANNDVNFKKYDKNGDGVVDFVHIIYAGYSEASGGSSESIWPHNWYLSSAIGSSVKLDGVRIDQYSCSSELNGNSGKSIEGISAIAHEFSHSLGLPDFYDVDYNGHFGMSSWSIMANGCYNEDGYTPAAYTAYEKEFLGWLKIETLDTEQDITLAPLADGGKAYRINSNESTNEYYIVENIQQKGWNRGAYGHGMLVTHVDYDRTAWNSNSINDTDHQRMTIIPADNSLLETPKDLAGDPYPGSSGNNELSDSSEPASLTNEGNPFSQPITDIKENEDGTVTFSFMKNCGEATTANSATKVTSSSFNARWGMRFGSVEYILEVFHITGEIPQNEKDWNINLLNTKGELIQTHRTKEQHLTIDNLEPENLYCYRVRCLTDGVLSPSSNLVFVTTAADGGILTAPQLNEPTIRNDSVLDIRWTKVSGAQKYILEHEYLGEYDSSPIGDGRELLAEDFVNITSSCGDITRVLDIYTKVPDWTGNNVFAEGGAVRLGCPEERGTLATPTLPCTSDYITIYFSVAKHDEKDEKPIFHVCLASDADSYYYVDQVGAYITSTNVTNYYAVLGPLSTGSYVAFISNNVTDSKDDPIIDLSNVKICWGDCSNDIGGMKANYIPLREGDNSPAHICRYNNTTIEDKGSMQKIPTSGKKYIEVDDTCYTFEGLSAGYYSFRVRAVKDSDLSPFSESASCEAGNTTFMVDELNYDIVSDELSTVCVSPLRDGKFYSGDITIPSTITHDGVSYTVTELADSLFRGCTDLQSIVVPTTVTFAGTNLFKGCKKLEWVDWQGSAPIDSASFAGVSNNVLLYVGKETTVEADNVILVRDGLADSVTVYINSPFIVPKSFQASYIQYSKDFSQKNIIGTTSGWETIVLPFDVQSIKSDKEEELTPFGATGGMHHFWLGQYNGNSFDYATSIKANIPYVISFPNSDDYDESMRINGTVTFSATNATIFTTTAVPSVPGKDFNFVPVYKKVYKASNRYMLNTYDYGLGTTPAGSTFTPDRMSLRTFGAYMESNKVGSAAPMHLPIHFNMPIEDDMPDVTIHDVFGIDGRMVRSADETTVCKQIEGLPAGIYIIGGKKQFVR